MSNTYVSYLHKSVFLICAFFVSFSISVAQAPLNKVLPISSTLENQEMLILEITVPPGQASPPHRHNAYVYVYVLEGEMEMQVKGGPLTTVKAGETFYETPEDIHQVSRNPSSTTEAKFLVHMLKSADAPATVAAD